MNFRGIKAVYFHEMDRMKRTLFQSLFSPVLSTLLYFLVFGFVLGSRVGKIDGVSYASFIVPGILTLSLLNQSVANASFGFYFPKLRGTLYELLAAPLSFFELAISFIAAAVTKSVIIAFMILLTVFLFSPIKISQPFILIFFIVWVSTIFSLLGFIIGLWSESFEHMQLIPIFVITPLTFLGGSFYSINMLPPLWKNISLFNPVVHINSALRWSFYMQPDIPLTYSLLSGILMTTLFTLVIYIIFSKTNKIKD